MKQTTKILSIIIVINIIMSLAISIFSTQSYAIIQTTSTDIKGLDEKKYPGIKSMIQELQKAHPNWNFKLLYTGLDWEDVIKGEYTGHGTSPKNLVPANDENYAGRWICSKCGTKLYDSGNWYCASEEAIGYMMDPRNSLNESDIFQFLQLSYIDCSYDDIKTMVWGYSYLNNKSIINTIIETGKKYDVNPYYIVARIIQEQGKGGNVLVTGAKYTGKDGVIYSGYYNIFNINASGNSKAEIYTNALSYAKEKGWTSLEKSIEGGITTIANNYISNGQDTMYFQKFNVSSTKYTYYTHQYMQNILAAQSESTTLRKTLREIGYLDGKYTFIIPVYKNMTSKAISRPDIKTEEKTVESKIKIDEKEKTITVIPEVKIKDVLDYIGSKDEVKDKSGKIISETQYLGTRYTIGEKYKVIVLGDVNGDGKVNTGDTLAMSQHIENFKKILNSDYLKAADINMDSKINTGDSLALRQHVENFKKINW